ncbi:9112_t:CDS:2 [Diversispora eburnea]|uniref:9112_t:CDS:1 n=1 Tax=Diversispora eburnea TaxID=1213867 RepID=A0A9N8VIU9_9GLOM|nr:9112_t:CDS:2 [Diversispora eburnea]
MVHKLLSPRFWLDKFIILFLELILLILQSTLYLIKGNEDKQTAEKRLKEQQKERAIPKDSETEICTSMEQMVVNIITGIPSELKPDETVNEICVPNEPHIEPIKEINKTKSQESEIRQNQPLEIVCPPFERKTTNNNNIDPDSKIIPIEFHWRHGGNKVFVTGDFDNWQATKHEMHRKPGTDDFVAIVDIDLTKQHQFKFVVDGSWHFNGDLPTHCDECGNVNNVIYAFPAGPLSPEFKEHVIAPFAHMTAAY